MRKKAAALTMVCVLIVFAVIGVSTLTRTRLEQPDQNENDTPYASLISAVTEADDALRKILHTTSPTTAAYESATVSIKSTQARLYLERVTESELYELDGFFESLSETAHQLIKKHASGEPLTDETRNKLSKISQDVSALSQKLSELERHVQDGKLSGDKLQELQADLPPPPQSSNDAQSGAPKLLQNMGELTRAEASSAAAGFMGLRANAVRFDSERDQGGVPVYVFTGKVSGGVAETAITKSGGYVAKMTTNRTPLTAGLPIEHTIAAAEKHLRASGFYGFIPVDHKLEGKKVMVTFAYANAGVTYYSDKITVTVGRDNGSMTAFDSLDYIKHHHPRDLPKPTISKSDAEAKLPDTLTAQYHTMAVTDSNIYCHEFICVNEQGDRFVVHVNAETGEEEDIGVRR